MSFFLYKCLKRGYLVLKLIRRNSMDSQEKYRVKVEGPGLNLDREISPEVVGKIVMLIIAGSSAQTFQDRTGQYLTINETISNDLQAPSLSVREYMDIHQPKRNPDKITAIGCFLNEYRAKSTFTKSDLEILFQEAAEPIPGNLPRDLKWAIRAGWVAVKPDDKSVFYVTKKGVDVVAKNFPKNILKKTPTVPMSSKRGKKSRKVEEKS
jgi:hypothetical protein